MKQDYFEQQKAKSRRQLRNYVIVFFALVLLGLGASLGNSLKVEEFDAKVVAKQVQQKIHSTDGDVSTEIRYLIATENETFVCKSSILNGKFNNSDIYMRIDTGRTYHFKVCGYGKGFFFNYRNVLSAKLVK